jgi:hypothetical protein
LDVAVAETDVAVAVGEVVVGVAKLKFRLGKPE